VERARKQEGIRHEIADWIYRIGIDGRPMAANLLKAGYDVTVWNRTPSRADGLVAQGAKRAATPRDVATASEVVFTIVSDPPRVGIGLWGGDGVFAGLRSGKRAGRFKHGFPALERRAAAAAAAQGAEFLEAPVTGGPGERKRRVGVYGRRRNGQRSSASSLC